MLIRETFYLYHTSPILKPIHGLKSINVQRVFTGHVLRLPSVRPVSAAVQWTPEGGKRKRGRPRKTWQDTLRDDLQAMDVDWEEAKSVAGDRREWRSLVAQCSSGNRRT